MFSICLSRVTTWVTIFFFKLSIKRPYWSEFVKRYKPRFPFCSACRINTVGACLCWALPYRCLTQYLRQNEISVDVIINCLAINRRRSCQLITCCDHQKSLGNTTSGFSAPTHANLVETELFKAWYILFSGLNKNVFNTTRNTFLQKLSPKAP